MVRGAKAVGSGLEAGEDNGERFGERIGERVGVTGRAAVLMPIVPEARSRGP